MELYFRNTADIATCTPFAAKAHYNELIKHSKGSSAESVPKYRAAFAEKNTPLARSFVFIVLAYAKSSQQIVSSANS